MFGRWNSDTEYLNHYECPPALKPQTRFRNTRWASAESLCSLCVSVLPLRHSTPPEVFLLFLPDVSPHSPLTLLHSHPRPPLQGDREMNTVRSQPDHQTTNHQLDRLISESLCRETKTQQILRVIKVVIRLEPAKSLNLSSDSSDLRLFTGAQRTSVLGSSHSKSYHYTTQKCRNMQQSSTQRLCTVWPVTRLAAAGLKLFGGFTDEHVLIVRNVIRRRQKQQHAGQTEDRRQNWRRGEESGLQRPRSGPSTLNPTFPTMQLHSILLKSLSLYSVRVECLFLSVFVFWAERAVNTTRTTRHVLNVASCSCHLMSHRKIFSWNIWNISSSSVTRLSAAQQAALGPSAALTEPELWSCVRRINDELNSLWSSMKTMWHHTGLYRSSETYCDVISCFGGVQPQSGFSEVI